MLFRSDAMDRLAIWKIRTAVVDAMDSTGRYSANYARLRLARTCRDDPTLKTLDIVFVDEVQDLPPCDLMVLKALCRGPVIMAGDNEQAVFRKGFSFRRAGIDIVGRSRTISMNFRNTMPVNDLAERFRQRLGTPDGDDPESLKAHERPSQSFRPEPPPELVQAGPGGPMQVRLLDKLRFYMTILGYNPETMTVLLPDAATLDDVVAAMQEAGIQGARMDDHDFSFAESKGVRLSLMKSAKGIDFAVVILYLPYLPEGVDVYDSGFNQAMVRNTLYVCLTRAMEQLAVIMPEKPEPGILIDLAQAFQVGAS